MRDPRQIDTREREQIIRKERAAVRRGTILFWFLVLAGLALALYVATK